MLNTQCLQNSVKSGVRIVLTLGSLPACTQQGAVSGIQRQANILLLDTIIYNTFSPSCLKTRFLFLGAGTLNFVQDLTTD